MLERYNKTVYKISKSKVGKTFKKSKRKVKMFLFCFKDDGRRVVLF